MATSTKSDFKIYDEQFQSGMWERLTQILSVFNAASNGTIVMLSEAQKGEYEKRAFFKGISGLVARRDPTATTSVTAKKLEQGEVVAVKVDRRIGPVQYTLDSIRKAGMSDEEVSFILGEMTAEYKMQDMLNTAVLAAEAALGGESGIIYDATGETTKTMTPSHLLNGLAKFGDQAERIRSWASHSKPYWDLAQNQAEGNVTNIADRTIYNATVGTINRPVVISDIPALKTANSSAADTYHTMGLVADALIAKETEQGPMVTELKTGSENLYYEFQGEYSFNLEIKGFAWNTSVGGASPIDSALGSAANWTKIAANDKDLAGVMVKTQ